MTIFDRTVENPKFLFVCDGSFRASAVAVDKVAVSQGRLPARSAKQRHLWEAFGARGVGSHSTGSKRKRPVRTARPSLPRRGVGLCRTASNERVDCCRPCTSEAVTTCRGEAGRTAEHHSLRRERFAVADIHQLQMNLMAPAWLAEPRLKLKGITTLPKYAVHQPSWFVQQYQLHDD
jgi:hypothetical protein